MLKKILTGIATFACAASVHAGPVSMSTSVNLNASLPDSSWPFYSMVTSVNVNGTLGSLDANSIQSAVLKVFAHSSTIFNDIDNEYDAYVNTGITKTVSGRTGKAWERNVTVEKKDTIKDTLVVSAGFADASATVGHSNSLTKTQDNHYDGYERIGTSSNYKHYYTDKYEVQDAWSGDVVVTLTLNSLALLDLKNDGILGLAIGTYWGHHFDITKIQLDFVALANNDGSVGGGANEVPVPGSLLLTGLGLAALANARRRKN
ncbi:PEP-CTERM sorting domain-containing protein [Pseudoduganella sp. OTU4001]|uniref:PEP-CTERM sorting domain-containing protein n=1 Tax=Pseudoduganella sp. OTU4001 TaxID=3043854 RepID=UPI00313E30F9